MDNLKIEKTKSTLAVDFNAGTGVLELAGSSYPENSSEFFQPLVNWIQKYFLEVTKKLTLNVKIDYMNSSSIKFLSDIIDKLENYHKSSGEVEINWYYKEDDEDMLDMGEEIKEDVSFKFNLISI